MARSARQHATRFYVAVTVSVLAVSGGIRFWMKLHDIRPAAAQTPDGAAVDWCGEGLEAIAGAGCFAPPATGNPKALLVYLHGRYAPESTTEELQRQTRVARLATARGYSVLALRGAQGQCADPQLATWWCWPSNERNAPSGPAFVARWSTALAEAERRAPPSRRVLLGFSNGGYFAALIASRALVPFDAVAIAHAGPVQPMSPAGATPPILLVDADDDPSGPEMSRLDADLSRESWPHAVVVREGGHALPEWDVDMSLTFFDRVRTERLPLTPPLGARTTRRPSEIDPSAPTPATSAAPADSASAPDSPSPADSATPTPPASPTPTPTPTASASAAATPTPTASASPTSPPAPSSSAPALPAPSDVLDQPP